MKKVRLKRDCVNCKYLALFPVVCCDIGVETKCYYLNKEHSYFGCRPKYAYECKKTRQNKNE